MPIYLVGHIINTNQPVSLSHTHTYRFICPSGNTSIVIPNYVIRFSATEANYEAKLDANRL